MSEYEYIYKIVKDMDGVDCYIKTGEIVRCKDCIHRFFCRDPLNREPDDFCSDGERRRE